jgi:Rrf2 family protein
VLSRKCKYGLKAVLRLASSPEGQPMLVADLARREHIPKKFLDLILLELKHRGVVQSRKGKGGGYQLRRPPSAITLGEIVRALEGPLAPIACVSQTAYTRCEDCDDEESCGIRMVMKQVRDATARILDSTTFADVSQSVARVLARRLDLTLAPVAPRPAEGAATPGADAPAAAQPAPRLSSPARKPRGQR